MIENADQIPWPVWIDKNSRIIFMKEKPGAVKTLFENKEAGLKRGNPSFCVNLKFGSKMII